MSRWDKLNIPHKGWTEIGMEDLGEENEPGDEIEYEQCEMCGNERIRYVHILTHPSFRGEIRVGCVCASKMTDELGQLHRAFSLFIYNRYDQKMLIHQSVQKSRNYFVQNIDNGLKLCIM